MVNWFNQMITRLLCVVACLSLLGCQHPCNGATVGDTPRVSNPSLSFVSKDGTHYINEKETDVAYAEITGRGSDANKLVIGGNAYAHDLRVDFTIRDVPSGPRSTTIPTTQVTCDVYVGDAYTPERIVANATLHVRRLEADCHDGWCDQDLDADISIDSQDSQGREPLHIGFTVVMKGAPSHSKTDTCTDIGIDLR